MSVTFRVFCAELKSEPFVFDFHRLSLFVSSSKSLLRH